MRTHKIWLAAVMALLGTGLFAHEPNRPPHAPTSHEQQEVHYRAQCANSLSQIDQEINNVRARLLGGGDCWWNLTEGRYIVPKVDVSTGAQEVSSLYAGSVWLGGLDSGHNLKMACQTYRNDGKNDFWPGPLTDADTVSLGGTTDDVTCKNWDFHFRVTGTDIRKHLRNLAEGNLDPNSIPRSLRGWPAQGNIYFTDIWGFELPSTIQGLGGFFDSNENGVYEPLNGDYPSIDIRGCLLDQFPDEMIFWIYNDEGSGSVHARTNGLPIKMEVQVQAFGYTTNDELNDMTFQRYKLINRANDRIDSMFFAMWVDPDLGCAYDDYIGCDTSRSLMVVYNQDAQDGTTGTTCLGGTPTYGTKVPILGVDYFRGPRDTLGNELGMSSFTYYNNGSGTPPPPQGTDDPNDAGEYYNYMTGSWRDGTPFTFGGNGKGGTIPTKYAFPDQPNNSAGWSMCTAGLPPGDRRTLQASGPFTLKPGAVNELIIGVPWVADIDYPCPGFDDIFRADQLAQGLFNTCFKLLNGPDAPDVDWLELNEEVVAVLTNSKPSNNFINENEDYSEVDPLADISLPEDARSYKFEGYQIFQLIDPNVSAADFDDPTKSRLVYEVDVKNGVKKIYNWVETRDPNTQQKIYYPEIKVEGLDLGIRHTFPITEDKFATGNNKTLINHKKYYFSAIAYAYNNYQTFGPLTQPIALGQQRPYLPGRKAGDGSQIRTYTVIPRPIVDRSLQASYGDGVVISRLEGAGTGENFLDLTEETLASLWNGTNPDTVLTYKQGRGPITVNIFNPFEVRDGEYEVRLVDGNLTDNKLDNDARWELHRLPDGQVIASERSIEKLNEQLVGQYGFSVSIAQAQEPGDKADAENGAIGGEVDYADPRNPWLRGYPDEDFTEFNWVHNDSENRETDPESEYDPQKGLSTIGNGWFVPYALANWRLDPTVISITPAWTEKGLGAQGALNANAVGSSDALRYANLRSLPNVDIVLTKDKSKWSRCVVVESASYFYTHSANETTYPPINSAYMTEGPPNKQRLMFDVRYGLSVGKDDANNDGLPDPDGAVYPDEAGIPAAYKGQPVRGMGWFPGYAIDVETGTRLNIFFGENSAYPNSAENPKWTGRDMLWNPTDAFTKDGSTINNLMFPEYYDYLIGGQHWVYVMKTAYDEGKDLRNRLTPEFAASAVAKVQQIGKIAWTGMLQLAPGASMKSLNDGLIPNETTIKLRVGNRYQPWYEDGNSKKLTGHPVYRFKIEGREAKQLTGIEIDNALDSIKMVPNPYYGYSQYESSPFSNIVKITNLPAKCTVTIYSLDGKFIRQYNRDEQYAAYQQITPALEWDLKNAKGIPVASGVYLVNVQSPGLGERTLKWFGIARQFDPSGL